MEAQSLHILWHRVLLQYSMFKDREELELCVASTMHLFEENHNCKKTLGSKTMDCLILSPCSSDLVRVFLKKGRFNYAPLVCN